MPERLTIDLHPVFRSDRDIDRMVRNVIIRAARENVGLVEIIHGKGAGKLRARVVGLLRQPGLRKLYRTIDTDTGNAGMLRVRF